MTKEQKLRELYTQHSACPSCPFGKEESNHKVFGEGSPNAQLMLIGEAPGAEEDRLKRPFVGRSGKLLDKLLFKIGTSRSEIFITNIVKCRPPHNRTPLPHEISREAKAMLKQEILIIKPHIICTLGSTATRLFVAENTPISQVRGKPITLAAANIVVIPTYHPAYILRNPTAEKFLENDLLFAWRLSQNAK